RYGDPPPLHSFPTRRSSDLGAESGIFVSGNNSVIQQNTITEASVGILKQTGSLGNLIRLNDVFDTLVAVQDPASPGLAGVVSPEDRKSTRLNSSHRTTSYAV